MGRLDERVCLVTAAAAGIGLAIVRRFAAEGARVVAADLAPHPDPLGPDAPIVTVQGDMTDAAAVRAAVRTCLDRFGALDVLVNGVADATPAVPVTELDDALWERALRANVTSAFLACKAALPHMIAQGHGVIINIASQLGIAAQPGRSVYCASKAALIQLTKVLAIDHAREGIRVNALSPGAVITPRLLARYGTAEATEAALAPRHPIGRLGRPEEIAAAALFLASEDSSFMTGANLVVDGGYTAC
jgi:NAD(P)-dependent dehydrogenase (short-subunit alcohol dehydrogenase family)